MVHTHTHTQAVKHVRQTINNDVKATHQTLNIKFPVVLYREYSNSCGLLELTFNNNKKLCFLNKCNFDYE